MPHDELSVGQIPSADRLQRLDTQGTYTPVLIAATTNPNLGADGTIGGTWHRNGHMITTWGSLFFSGVGVAAGTGSYQLSLPFPFDPSLYDAGSTSNTVGSCWLQDSSSVPNRQPGTTSLFGTERLLFHAAGSSFVTDSSPFIWAAGDRLSWFATYLADPTGLP